MAASYEYTKPWNALLTSDGSGDYAKANMNGADGDFYTVIPDGQIVVVKAMSIRILHSAVMTLEGYGGSTALSGGVTIKLKNSSDATIVDWTEKNPILTNLHWSDFCQESSLVQAAAGPLKGFWAKYSFEQNGDRKGLFLKGGGNEKFVVRGNESMATKVSQQYFFLQGVYLTPGTSFGGRFLEDEP